MTDPAPCVTVIMITFTFPALCSEQGKINNIGQKNNQFLFAEPT